MKPATWRLPLLMAALIALLAAMWAGLLRLGWQWPVLQPSLPVSHGPLMVSGFLGTLISLERAVALAAEPRHRWAYLAPLFSGVGGLLLAAGLPGLTAPLLITLGSAVLGLIFGVFLRRQPALYMTVMACGAAAWLVGNLLWLGGVPLSQVVYWWMGFLVLTIAGERLELGRMLRLSRLSRGLFLAAAGLILGGLLWIGAAFQPGVRLFSVGLLALAAWLARYDIARRTVRLTGLTRYIAVCLLSGYVWLGIGGALGLAYAAGMGGFLYDASLHAILLGFVFGMIFGHAPIIFPAVLNLPVVYRPVLYLPLIFLQISLILRISGDLGGWQMLRQWGGLLNALTLLLFLALMRLGAKSAPA